MKLVPLIVAALASRLASADPIRLRADALATTASPAGLLVLDAGGPVRAGLSAEAVVWMAGARTPGEDVAGDVLVIALKGQTRDGRLGGQVGRFVSTLGALRPVQVDGATLRARLPHRLDVEAVAGMPVPTTGLGNGRSWDWLVGGRLARRLGDYGAVGIAYTQRRDAGILYDEEVGVDAGVALDKRHDVGARVAYDLAHPGLAEISLVASRRKGALRADVYARHRDASRLLPASSLFSVIGDVASQRGGVAVTWRAAPRLDVIADVAARRIDASYGEELVARARLRLDERGASLLGGELRRTGGGDFGWTGARGMARIALPHHLAVSTELELVVPDHDRGRGRVWPWGLVATSWDHGPWSVAVAVEASTSAEYRYRVDGLVQASRRWSVSR